MSAFDNRIIQVGLKLANGQQLSFAGLAISARGNITTQSLSNECQCLIYNLTREQRNQVLTQSSALNYLDNTVPKVLLTLDVGRDSYGTFRLFEGNVITSNITQPPDIGLEMNAQTFSLSAGNILAATAPKTAKFSLICQAAAQANGLSLEFTATDKNINNYAFSGSARKQIEDLKHMGPYLVYIDNTRLVVHDAGKPRTGDTVTISAATGMVGVPQVTYSGAIVRMMIDPNIKLGGLVTLQSEINPAANGDYIVWDINYEVSNRDQPFWYVLNLMLASRIPGAGFQ